MHYIGYKHGFKMPISFFHPRLFFFPIVIFTILVLPLIFESPFLDSSIHSCLVIHSTARMIFFEMTYNVHCRHTFFVLISSTTCHSTEMVSLVCLFRLSMVFPLPSTLARFCSVLTLVKCTAVTLLFFYFL